jgi:hypothetical protein
MPFSDREKARRRHRTFGSQLAQKDTDAVNLRFKEKEK